VATQHGSKTYFQVLLDPNRADLIKARAESEGVRPTAWIREALYAYLERIEPQYVYNQAKADDEAVWRESVRRRVEGRTKRRAERKKESVDADD
jgi:hypothetical protein